MAFWSAGYSGDGGKDPKRAFKFKIEIAGVAGGQPLVWWAKKVTKPNFDVTEVKHSFSDKEYYFPGRVQWQTVSMTLVDPVSPIDAVAQTNAIITGAGYQLINDPNSTDLMKTMSKKKAIGALGSCRIIQLDSEGLPLETWTLNQPFIKNVKFGELSYESDDLVEIELEIRYDWAQCDVITAGSLAVSGGNNLGVPAATTFFAPSGSTT